MSRFTNLAASAQQLLSELHVPQPTPFLKDWPTVSTRRSIEPESVPVLRWLLQVRASAPPFSAPFVNAFVDSAPLLAWQRSYTIAEVSAAFLDDYGWTEPAAFYLWRSTNLKQKSRMDLPSGAD